MFQNFPPMFCEKLRVIRLDQLNYSLLGTLPSLAVISAKTFLRECTIGYDGISLTFSSPYYNATSSSNMEVATISTATASAIEAVTTFTSSSMEGISATVNQSNAPAAQTNAKQNINEVNGHRAEEQNSKRRG